MVGSETHPRLYQAWMWVARVHERAGDEAGQQEARSKALKCKSAAVRTRDGSHKAKQRGPKKARK